MWPLFSNYSLLFQTEWHLYQLTYSNWLWSTVLKLYWLSHVFFSTCLSLLLWSLKFLTECQTPLTYLRQVTDCNVLSVWKVHCTVWALLQKPILIELTVPILYFSLYRAKLYRGIFNLSRIDLCKNSIFKIISENDIYNFM